MKIWKYIELFSNDTRENILLILKRLEKLQIQFLNRVSGLYPYPTLLKYQIRLK